MHDASLNALAMPSHSGMPRGGIDRDLFTTRLRTLEQPRARLKKQQRCQRYKEKLNLLHQQRNVMREKRVQRFS